MTAVVEDRPAATRPHWLRAPRLLVWCLGGALALAVGFPLLSAEQLRLSPVLLISGVVAAAASLLVVLEVRAVWAHILRWVLLVPGVSVLAAAVPFAMMQPGPGLVLWGSILLTGFGTFAVRERLRQGA